MMGWEDINSAFDQLAGDNITTAITSLYNATTGSWWIVFVYLIVIAAAYAGTRSEEALAFVGLFLGAALVGYVPSAAQPFFYIAIALSLAILLWRLFGRGE